MSHIAAREKIVYYMQEQKLDILVLLETHINTNSTETHDGYKFVFSTSTTDDMRKNATAKRDEAHRNGSGYVRPLKGQGKNAMRNNPKGQGKGKGFQGTSRNCGKWGHASRECYAPKKVQSYITTIKDTA